MPTATIERPGPLARLSEEEVEQLLRGFPEGAITSAVALRTNSGAASLETFLIHLLTFYLPAGTHSPDAAPSGSTHLRDQFGLDSLSMAEAMFKLEEVFDIRVEAAEITEIVTLADAREILTAKLSETSSDPVT